MSELDQELRRIEGFFRKAAESAIHGNAEIVRLLESEDDLGRLSDEIAELTEKEQLTGDECLRLSSAFFVYYIAGIASQRKG